MRAEQARLIFGDGHARLAPAVIRTAEDEQAQVEADYSWKARTFQLSVSSDAMRVESLRAQAALADVPWLVQVPTGTWSGRLECGNAGWRGDIELRDAQLPLPGLAEPVALQSAYAHIDSARIVLQGIHARAGQIAFQGEYRYDPERARPHRLRLAIPEADASELERVLMPSLHHTRGLIARALNLGRTALPEWLAERHLDATVQIGALSLSGVEVQAIQTHLLWDGAKAEFPNFQARLQGGRVTGSLAVNVRGSRPAYHLEAHAQDVQWKSGTLEADSVLETGGTGDELLSRLHATGTFIARGADLDALPDLESIAGTYVLAWTPAAPRLLFPELELVSGDDTYTGQGAMQPDGRLVVQLSDGSKEMHITGTLAQLRLDESAPR